MGNDLAPGRGREGEDRGLNKQAEVGGWYRPSSSPDIQPLTAGRPPARAPGGSAATAHRPAPHRPPRSSFPPTLPPAGPRLPSRPRPGPRASQRGSRPAARAGRGSLEPEAPLPSPASRPPPARFRNGPRLHSHLGPRCCSRSAPGKQAAGCELPGAGLVRGFALPHLHGGRRSALGLRSLPRASHIASAGCPSAPSSAGGGTSGGACGGGCALQAGARVS